MAADMSRGFPTSSRGGVAVWRRSFGGRGGFSVRHPRMPFIRGLKEGSDLRDVLWRASLARWRRIPPIGFIRPGGG